MNNNLYNILYYVTKPFKIRILLLGLNIKQLRIN